MGWYWWALAIVFIYFSAGFAYFPIFDQCIERTRLQWLIRGFAGIFTLPMASMPAVCGIAEAVLANIERNPGSIGCWRLQKFLFFIIFGLPLLWIFTAGLFGLGVLKILGIPDRRRSCPES